MMRSPSLTLNSSAHDVVDDLTYVQVTCLACAQAHLVNPKNGKVPGSGDEKMCGALCVHTTRARSYGSALCSVF